MAIVKQLWRRCKGMRLVALAGALLWLGAVMLSVHVSTLDVGFFSVVYGSRSVVCGQAAAFRVAALDPRSLRPVQGGQVTARLVDDNGRVYSRAERVGSGGLVVDIPRRCPDQLHVDFEYHFESLHDAWRVTLQPRTQGSPGGWHYQPQLALHYQALASSPQLQLDFFAPAGGVIASGFAQTVHVQLRQAGQPWVGAQVWSKAGDWQARTDAWGMLPLPLPELMLRERHLVWRVGGANAPLQHLTLKSTALPWVLEQRSAVAVSSAEACWAQLKTQPFRGGVFVDTWQGRHLLHSAFVEPQQRRLRVEGAQGEARFAGWMRLEVYRGLQAAAAERTQIWCWQGSESPRTLPVGTVLGGEQAWLQAALGRADRTEREVLWQRVLPRMMPAEVAVNPLVDTLPTRKVALAARIAHWQSWAHGVLVVLGGGTALLILVWAVLLLRQRQRAVAEVLQGDQDVPQTAWRRCVAFAATWHSALWVVLMMALLWWGIYVLLTRLMHWQ